LLGIGRTYRPEHAEVVAPQAETQGLLRSRQIELVDIHHLEVLAAIQLTTIVTAVIEEHARTVLRSLNLTGAPAVKQLLALLSLLKPNGLTASAGQRRGEKGSRRVSTS